MRLLVANDFSEDLREDHGEAAYWVQRLVWFAEDDDVLVLPIDPGDVYVDYVTAFTGVNRASLKVIVPPPKGIDSLTADRLMDPGFLTQLDDAVGGRPIEQILALWPGAAVAWLARSLGAESAMPGCGFIAQAGGALVTSKAIFRAIAGGVGVPLPDGTVCLSREAAARAIAQLLGPEQPVILKRDYLSGGRGNEIITLGEDVRPVGARRSVNLLAAEEVCPYLDERWDWLSDSGRSWVIVERYISDSRAFFADFVLTDGGVELAGHGEMLSAPLAIGEIMPSPGLAAETLEKIVDGAERLSQAVRGMGYRGRLCVDSIVTPSGDVLFTEYNGRVHGGVHFYEIIGRKVLGADYGNGRIIVERLWPAGWAVPSFEAALQRLTQAQLTFDRVSRTGAILSNAYDPRYKGVPYCIVAENTDAAWTYDSKIKPLFAEA